MLRLGILPKIDGIYTPYLVDMTVLFENDQVREKVPLDEALDYWKTTDVCPCNSERPAVDGVFVSHAILTTFKMLVSLIPAFRFTARKRRRFWRRR